VHSFDLMRKMVEKGLKITQIDEPPGAPTASTGAIHNYDNRSDRYVISHKELFLGHFNYTPRNRRKIVSLTAEEALNNFEERLLPLLEAQAQAEAKRCMSCGQCFECDNCVVYCPQTAVFKVKKSQSTTGPLRRHRLQQVHRLPHLQGCLPHRLHPDGPRGVGRAPARLLAAIAWRVALRCLPGLVLAAALRGCAARRSP
jgi:ferredoxin